MTKLVLAICSSAAIIQQFSVNEKRFERRHQVEIMFQTYFPADLLQHFFSQVEQRTVRFASGKKFRSGHNALFLQRIVIALPCQKERICSFE